MSRITMVVLLGLVVLGGSNPACAQDKPMITIPGVDKKIPLDTKDLDLSESKVTDAGLKELVALKNLTTLGLGGTKVTDAGMKELVGHKNLKTLGLSSTKLTDTGVKELATLKNLTFLDLSLTGKCQLIPNSFVPVDPEQRRATFS